MILALGSRGDEVRQVKQRLSDLGMYTGLIDGEFGGGLQSAVQIFQKADGLPIDGIVGPRTWAALFPGSTLPGAPDITAQPIEQRCLALTAAFETSAGIPDCYCALTGDFDGQGLSLGALQWNIGQGTLQPLLSEMMAAHSDVISGIFHSHLDTFKNMLSSPRDQQLAWARSIQDPRCAVVDPWRSLLQALARTPEFQAIQVEHAGRIHQKARAMCRSFGLGSERALALFFDILVQNGSISAETTAKIQADFAQIPGGDPLDVEVRKLQSIANRRADAAPPAFAEDVRSRKLTIANGRGMVHNIPYDLERQFGIRLEPFLA
ncbi:MAG TPA: peptidoglycan-binding protein [Bryobacteraceae bacterium]|nr:peptidoglycan-binding protein [Bryobacteraceae bacterium]